MAKVKSNYETNRILLFLRRHTKVNESKESNKSTSQ